jgi:hypothetical protein
LLRTPGLAHPQTLQGVAGKRPSAAVAKPSHLEACTFA